MDDKIPSSYKIGRQLDNEKISFLSSRINELIKSNKELRQSSGQTEKDTHDIVLYFQREMEIKDDVILRLNEELVKFQTQLKFEVEKVRKTFESEMQQLKDSSDAIINDLRDKLTAAELDLKSVERFLEEKNSHDALIKKLEKSIIDQRKQLIDAMEDQERRFLEEKSHLFKELDDQKLIFRDLALKEARNAMGDEIKKIVADNNRMFEELKFHHAESSEIQSEKSFLKFELTNAKREIAILAEKEIEYAKQAHNRSKEIKILRERVEQLEKQQLVNMERFKTRAKELKSTVTKELEEATLDAASLRRLIQIKNKELRHMKSLAATILNQRTETEQFFLESLQEVRDVIRKERKKKEADSKLMSNRLKTNQDLRQRGGGTTTTVFPSLTQTQQPVDGKQLMSSSLDVTKVNLKDLSWEDKELVLRVLFSKMNDAATKQSVNNNNKKQQQQQQSDPIPLVFVSEGLLGHEEEEEEQFRRFQQDNFEVLGEEEDM